jgi:hypothetical protein
MEEKECFKCNKIKPLNEFYKHFRMADGHLNKCKECTKKDVNEHRGKNLEKIRKYDRERSKLPHRRKHLIDNAQQWRIKNPLKYHAHSILSNAIRDGKIIKQPCEVCGSTYRIHGHHDDYYKPLGVNWLCAKHHAERHKELKEMEMLDKYDLCAGA